VLQRHRERVVRELEQTKRHLAVLEKKISAYRKIVKNGARARNA
jgi:hypothetical protein